MTELHEFKPDWTIAPSEILQEWISEHGLTVRVLSVSGQNRVVTKDGAALLIEQVLNREPLTAAHAKCLERCTRVSERFWLALEHNYRAGLAAGLTDATES